MATLPTNKAGWIRRIQRSSLPSFGHSIDVLINGQSFSKTHTKQLTKLILNDPSLTTSVLKRSNSAYYNVSGKAVKTVSRAITMLGSEVIKEICTSCLILETFLNESSNQLMKNIIAKAFHTAYQARNFALIRGDKCVEEVFISSMILNIGELSLVASIGSDDQLMSKLEVNYPFSNGKEKDLVGCYFRSISKSLLRLWGISPMLDELLSGHYIETSASRSILIANSFANSYELNGVEKALEQHEMSLMAFTQLNHGDIRNQIRKATELTQNILSTYGLILNSNLKKKLKGSNDVVVEPKKENDGYNLDGYNLDNRDKSIKSPFIELSDARRKLLLDVIYDLTVFTDTEYELDTAIHLLLEGLSRSGNFDTSIVALFDPSHSRLVAKYELSKKEKLIEQFNFDLKIDIPEVEQSVIKKRLTVDGNEFQKNGNTKKYLLIKPKFHSCLLAPFIINNKVQGCFYVANKNQLISSSQQKVFEILILQSKKLLWKTH